MFIAALFIIAERWKHPKCPSAGEWVNRVKHSHTREQCSAIKRNEVLVHATTWMNLANIMLSEKLVTKDYILYGSIQ